MATLGRCLQPWERKKKIDITEEAVPVSVPSERWPDSSARRLGAFHSRCVHFKARGIWRIKAAFYLSQRTSGEKPGGERATREPSSSETSLQSGAAVIRSVFVSFKDLTFD